MRSITTFDLQYAHRFYGFQGEAQYLHGHTGTLTIEVEDTVEEGVNMVSYLTNQVKNCRNFRKDVKEGELQQLIDDIIEELDSVIYKLKNLMQHQYKHCP